MDVHNLLINDFYVDRHPNGIAYGCLTIRDESPNIWNYMNNIMGDTSIISLFDNNGNQLDIMIHDEFIYGYINGQQLNKGVYMFELNEGMFYELREVQKENLN